MYYASLSPAAKRQLLIISPLAPPFAKRWLHFFGLGPSQFSEVLVPETVHEVRDVWAAHCPPNPRRQGAPIANLKAMAGAAVRVHLRGAAPPPAPGILVLLRTGVGRRELTNTRQICAALVREFPNESVQTLDPGTGELRDVGPATLAQRGRGAGARQPLAALVWAFRAAKVIVSPHGAQLSHIAMVDHPSVVEVQPEQWMANTNRDFSCNYVRLVVRGKGYSDNLEVNEGVLVRSVGRLLALSGPQREQCGVQEQTEG